VYFGHQAQSTRARPKINNQLSTIKSISPGVEPTKKAMIFEKEKEKERSNQQ